MCRNWTFLRSNGCLHRSVEPGNTIFSNLLPGPPTALSSLLLENAYCFAFCCLCLMKQGILSYRIPGNSSFYTPCKVTLRKLHFVAAHPCEAKLRTGFHEWNFSLSHLFYSQKYYSFSFEGCVIPVALLLPSHSNFKTERFLQNS